MTATLLALTIITGTTQPAPIDLGPWAGLVACESGPETPQAWTIQNPHSSASGRFQFLDTTWQMVTTHMGRPDLAALGRAMHATPADQLAAAEHLRTMPGGGLSHWVCGGYDHGTPTPTQNAPTTPPPLTWHRDDTFTTQTPPATPAMAWPPYEPGLT